MKTREQIEAYVAGQPAAKQADLRALEKLVLEVMPKGKLWFLDGRDASGKIVSNPNIGYGTQAMTYADGSSREFYQIGLSANTSGISVYIMGLDDKTALAREFGPTIGKANVTGYCIKFKALRDIDADVLKAAVRYGIEATS